MRTTAGLVIAVLIGCVCAACDQAVLDPASQTSFLDLKTINDTPYVLTVQGCWDAHCDDTREMIADTVKPSRSVEQAFWNNVDSGGVAAVEIIRGHRTVGCLAVHYRRGQQHATVRASDAHAC